MAASTRTGATLLAVVALSLSVLGVALAATDSNPTGSHRDPFGLNGYPPTSASLLVTVSTGQAYDLSANVNVDLRHDSVDATLNFPLVFSVAAVELRLVDHHLYAGAASGSSNRWLSVPMRQPALFGFALELTKPDIALFGALGHETITTSGYSTTYEFLRHDVAVTNLVGPDRSVVLGTLDWSITTGAQGEVTQSSITITTRHASTKVVARVLSYNKGGPISAPPRSDVRPASRSLVHELLHSAAFATILVPQNFTSLSQIVLK